MNYCALDFETSSRSFGSAVSLGLVKFNSYGEKEDSWYSLIKPRYPSFDPFCMSINGLDESDILSSHTFFELWPEIKAFIGDLPLVAHNAQFDTQVLKSTLLSWDLECPKYPYYCTLALSRKVLRCLDCHKLTYIASYYGWEYDAHNALSDAEICGRLFKTLSGENIEDEKRSEEFFTSLFKCNKRKYPSYII